MIKYIRKYSSFQNIFIPDHTQEYTVVDDFLFEQEDMLQKENHLNDEEIWNRIK